VSHPQALRGKWLALLCLLPFALFFFAFQIAPLLWVAQQQPEHGEGWSLANFEKSSAPSSIYRPSSTACRSPSGRACSASVIAILGSYSLRQVDSASCATSSWRFPT
jgi:putative spermidine/putrescine transport system permease protein